MKYKKIILIVVFILIILGTLFLILIKNDSKHIVVKEDLRLEAGLTGRAMESLYDLDDLLLEMNNSQYVLLGESTHGTLEYYLIRKYISKRLIQDFEFNFIAVEGDWASIYELNKYVKLLEDTEDSAREAMEHLDRWPVWMWKNEVILELMEWLREYNKNLSLEERVGFYGIDVYGAMDSYESVMQNLKNYDLVEKELKDLEKCFNNFNNDLNDYPIFFYKTGVHCVEEIENLILVVDKLDLDKKQTFLINQDLHVLKSAERHHRFQIYQSYASWNARASHFAWTVENIAEYYGQGSRGIVWAHNTHVGDSSFILNSGDMLNIGRIIRENNEVFILGFVKNAGRVSAGSRWGDVMQIMDVPVAKEGSYGKLFADNHFSKALFIFDRDRDYVGVRGHRAIGVVYDPFQETGNYVTTKISRRYDAVIFLNETSELLELSL